MEKGLLGALQQYINDALPGGNLNREVTPETVKSALSMMADLTPVVGGVKGAMEEYEQGNPGWAAINAATVPLDIATAGGGTLAKGLLAKGLPAALGMTAWHGSPHTFSKFLLDKIGTGEGAQAYGHGLYLAESPEVAQQYQKNLSQFSRIDGKPLVGNTTISSGARTYLLAENADLPKAIQNAKDAIARKPANELLPPILKELESLNPESITKSSSGSLY